MAEVKRDPEQCDESELKHCMKATDHFNIECEIKHEVPEYPEILDFPTLMKQESLDLKLESDYCVKNDDEDIKEELEPEQSSFQVDSEDSKIVVQNELKSTNTEICNIFWNENQTKTELREYFCSNCKDLFLCDLLIKDTVDEADIDHLCDKCKEVRCGSSLQQKKQEHSRVKNLSCDVCHKNFAYQKNLARHISIHTKTKKHYCGICKKDFTRKSGLNRHMNIHAGIKKHYCTICKKGFTDKWNFNSHMNIHAGIKNYCEICKKGFTQKVYLHKHMNIHAGIKRYSCEICKKDFTQKSDLPSHMNTHSGIINYSCDICKKAFTTKGDLGRHLNIHAGIKKYCEICKKGFTDRSNLRRHMNTHARIKRNL